MIESHELSKYRGGRAVVSDVTFRCEPGTVTGFLGPNGAGKTTTMRTLVGLSEPDSGEARILGGRYRDLPNPGRRVGILLDASAGVLETFTKPQHLSSLVAVLIAGALVAFKHRSAARVAVVVAWIEIAAFTFFHAIPVDVGPSKPYWGDGMGDALQWVGLLSIIAVSTAVVRVARRSSKVAVIPAAASLRS